MAYFVKVIPPHGRARIHAGHCKHCRDGQGQVTQDKGTGPTYWQPAYPADGFDTIGEARAFMNGLGPRYRDTGECPYCMREV
jgi:hypothetical protein